LYTLYSRSFFFVFAVFALHFLLLLYLQLLSLQLPDLRFLVNSALSLCASRLSLTAKNR
jgi:hypothetical protein